MKICIIIPSAEHGDTAGVRIRYERVAVEHATGSLQIITTPLEGIDQFKQFNAADVYLFSKTYNSVCFALARRLREEGKITGLDLFDDYFSQAGDARLQLFRTWLAQANGKFDFIICSTKRMQEVVRTFQPDVPLFLMPDPGPPVDLQRLRMLLQKKLEAVQRSRTINLLWFGIGDNRYFPVGIQDLSAYGADLANLRRDGWGASVQILTNPPSLTYDNLARLARLPISYRIEPWSLAAEKAGLEASLACFIPVNGQEFSQSKTLNRAVAALSSGSQVISNGFPLYKSLGDFIYPDCRSLLDDLKLGKPKCRVETVTQLDQVLNEQANPFKLAEKFEAFLTNLNLRRDTAIAGPIITGRGAESPALRSPAGGKINLGFLHGSEHDVRAHTLASQLGALSIKGPFTRANLNYDVYFNVDAQSGPAILFTGKTRELLPDQYKQSCVLAGKGLWAVNRALLESDLQFADRFLRYDPHLIKELVYYGPTMRKVIAACQKLLPDIEIYVSERGNLRMVTDGIVT